MLRRLRSGPRSIGGGSLNGLANFRIEVDAARLVEGLVISGSEVEGKSRIDVVGIEAFLINQTIYCDCTIEM